MISSIRVPILSYCHIDNRVSHSLSRHYYRYRYCIRPRHEASQGLLLGDLDASRVFGEASCITFTVIDHTLRGTVPRHCAAVCPPPFTSGCGRPPHRAAQLAIGLPLLPSLRAGGSRTASGTACGICSESERIHVITATFSRNSIVEGPEVPVDSLRGAVAVCHYKLFVFIQRTNAGTPIVQNPRCSSTSVG